MKLQIWFLVLLVFLVGCTQTQQKEMTLLEECTQVCFSNQPDNLPNQEATDMAYFACNSACLAIDTYSDEKTMLATIQMYKDQLKFEQDFSNGLYDSDIKQCVSWKNEAIIAKNQHWHFQRNFNDAHQQEVEVYVDETKSAYKQSVRTWLREEKNKPFCIEFKEKADVIKAKEKKVMEECYPIMFEYKTLVFSSRGELDRHPDLEKETIDECLNKVDKPEFNEYIEGIKQDIPNWQ